MIQNNMLEGNCGGVIPTGFLLVMRTDFYRGFQYTSLLIPLTPSSDYSPDGSLSDEEHKKYLNHLFYQRIRILASNKSSLSA